MSGLSRQELIERHRALADRHAVYGDLSGLELMELRAVRAELDALEMRAETDALETRLAQFSEGSDALEAALAQERARAERVEARVRELEARLPSPEQVSRALEQAERGLDALAKRTGTKFKGDLP